MSKKLIYLFSFVLFLCLIRTSAAEDVDPSLVGWWKFDEGFGDVALDSSGNNNTRNWGNLRLAGRSYNRQHQQD